METSDRRSLLSTPDPPRPRGLLPHLPAVAFFALACVLITWPLAARMDDTLVSWGDPVFQTWTLAWDWHALTTDPLRLFDANIFYPWRNTLAYSDHLLGQALVVLPVLAITDNGILAWNLATLLALVFSALGGYLLVYDLTGNRGAALVAGFAYAFAPPRMAHLEHLQLLWAPWPPLALLCLRRIMRPVETRVIVQDGAPPGMQELSTAYYLPRMRRELVIREDRAPWYAALAGCIVLQGLSGFSLLAFTLVMLAIAGVAYAVLAFVERDWEAYGRLGLAALACLLAGLLLLPTLVPSWQVHQDLRVAHGESEVTRWSAGVRDYLAVAPTNRAWSDLLGEFHRGIEQSLFPGIMLLALAAIGLLNRHGGRERWVLLAVTLGAISLSFGLRKDVGGVSVPGPYQLLYDVVPGFSALRVPARVGLLALVGLAGLAGLGVDRIWRAIRDDLPLFPRYPHWIAVRPFVVGGLALALAVGGVTAEAAIRLDLPDPLPVPANADPPVYAWLRDNPAPTIELPMVSGATSPVWHNYWSLWHWSDLANGASAIVPPTVEPFREAMASFPSEATVRLLQGIGVEHIVLHRDLDASERARIEAALATDARFALAFEDAGDRIYTLARDRWMWRIAAAIPAGERVDLANAGADPLAFGFLLAILQRTGNVVTGTGQLADYHYREGGADACYAVLLESDQPSFFGYLGAARVAQEGGLAVYRRQGCE